MTCRLCWFIFFALCSLRAFADDALDCASEHIVNLTLAEKEVRQIGNHECETSLSIKSAELGRQSILTLNFGNYTIGRFEQKELASSQWFRTNSTIESLNILENASVAIHNSTLTSNKSFQFAQSTKLTLQNTNMTFEGRVHIVNPNNSFRLINGSSLTFKEDIVIDFQQVTAKRVTFISSIESSVNFSNTGVELRSAKNIYVPSSFSLVMLSHLDKTSRNTGSFRLINNKSIARKFIKSSKGVISRHSGSTVYSKAASKEDTREAARLLDDLIPLAEADPTSREARILAYFDQITDQSFYDQEVVQFQRHNLFGRLYPEPLLESLIPNRQEFIVLTVLITAGLFLHHFLEYIQPATNIFNFN